MKCNVMNLPSKCGVNCMFKLFDRWCLNLMMIRLITCFGSTNSSSCIILISQGSEHGTLILIWKNHWRWKTFLKQLFFHIRQFFLGIRLNPVFSTKNWCHVTTLDISAKAYVFVVTIALLKRSYLVNQMVLSYENGCPPWVVINVFHPYYSQNK